MSDEELKTVFVRFCDAVKKGSCTATDKTVTRICKDCKLYTKVFDANRCDIEFRGFIGNAKRDIDFIKFKEFIETRLSKAYALATKIDQEKAIDLIKEKIVKAGFPIGHGVTKICHDAATDRLTNVKGYTGAHKERFDTETGLGRGKEGREYIADAKAQEGYVGAYKQMGTYNKKN